LLGEIRELKESLTAATEGRREAWEGHELRLQELNALRDERNLEVRANRQAAQLVRMLLHGMAALARMYRIDAAKELGDGARS
jgi:hypothetical protein